MKKAKVKVLRIKKVVKKVGLSRPSIYRLMRIGEFPKQIRIGAKAVGWLETDIDAHILSRVAESKSMGMER